MILCHKCSGILGATKDENTEGLNGCGCISGWVRGFESNLTRPEAIMEQMNACVRKIDMYRSQKCDPAWVESEEQTLERLRRL